MDSQVFIRVVGFTPVERHALNTVFRLSMERPVSYWLWTPETPVAPRLVLLDGLDEEAPAEALLLVPSDPSQAPTPFIWVGPQAPAQAARVFGRPVNWTQLVRAMDELIGYDPGVPAHGGHLRGLIVSDNSAQRAVQRCELARLGMTAVDEAETAEEALALAGQLTHGLAVVDADLAGHPDTLSGWQLVESLRRQAPSLRVVLTGSSLSWWQRRRAHRLGALAALPHPLQAVDLVRALQKL